MFWLAETYYGLLLIPLQFPGFYYTFTPTMYYGNTPFYAASLQTIYFYPPESLPPEIFAKCAVIENSIYSTDLYRVMVPNLFQEKKPISKFNVRTGDYSRMFSAYLGNSYLNTNFFGAIGYFENYNNENKRNAGALSIYREIPDGYFTLFASAKQDIGAYLKWGYIKFTMGYQDSFRYNLHFSSREISIGLQNNRFYLSGLVPLQKPLFSLYFRINQDKEYIVSPSYILTENLSIYGFKSNKNAGLGIHSPLLNIEINQNMDILCGVDAKWISGFFRYVDKSISGGINIRYAMSFKHGKLSPEIRIKALREDTLSHIDTAFLLHIIDASIYAGLENLTGTHYNIGDGLLPDGYMRYYWGISWHFTN